MLFNILAEEGGKTNNWTSYILIIFCLLYTSKTVSSASNSGSLSSCKSLL